MRARPVRLESGCRAARVGELFRELRANGFGGTLTACVFAWEEKAEESSLFMREKISEHLPAWT
ncbi:hypothetical protein [Streptomyces sp. Ag109_O5-1]|uniref:hypothetical protein n=1 Tax=Streptomyces sp. Ag109_O5-1 TaxID=1938851 RepID=UPI00288A4BB5|nr:hypothetical protein [Streptomyces sp. Ag109_O5-1]